MKSKSFSFKKWARSRAGQQVFICIGFMIIPLLLLFFIYLLSVCGNDQIQFL